MITERRFPIMHDTEIKSVPWAVMEPHRAQAIINHHQNLENLAARGGVTPEEAVAIIEGRAWMRMPFTEARDRLAGYVRAVEPAPADAQKQAITEAIQLVDFLRNTLNGTARRHHLNRLRDILERAL